MTDHRTRLVPLAAALAFLALPAQGFTPLTDGTEPLARDMTTTRPSPTTLPRLPSPPVRRPTGIMAGNNGTGI